MATKVTGDLYEKLDAKLFEIKRQIRQPGGYPYDPEKLNKWLQEAIEGQFPGSFHGEVSDDGEVICFSVFSNGNSGKDWINYFESKGIRINDDARELLLSKHFTFTRNLPYEIVIIKGGFFSDDDRVTQKIREEADRRGFKTPPAEVACFIRDRFSDTEIKEMGLRWIVARHKPIKDSGGYPHLLCAGTDDPRFGMDTEFAEPGGGWLSSHGFAFINFFE